MAFVSEKGKYVRIDIEFWYDKDGQIHIVYDDGKGEGEHFHTTVNDKDDSIRGHRNLFYHLQAVLKKHGKWPDYVKEAGVMNYQEDIRNLYKQFLTEAKSGNAIAIKNHWTRCSEVAKKYNIPVNEVVDALKELEDK